MKPARPWRFKTANKVANVPPIHVLYNLQNREIEFDLLPWSHTNKMPIMAYSPVGHSGQLLRNAALNKIAQSRGATPAQIALAWVLRQPEVIAIPKGSTEAHVRANAASQSKIDERRSDQSRPRIFSTEIKEIIADALIGAPHASK